MIELLRTEVVFVTAALSSHPDYTETLFQDVNTNIPCSEVNRDSTGIQRPYHKLDIIEDRAKMYFFTYRYLSFIVQL